MVCTPSTVGYRWGECEMSSISSFWRAGSGAHRFGCGPRKVSSSGTGVALRLLAVALTEAALAACAQQPPPIVTNVSRPAAPEGDRKADARQRAPAESERPTGGPTS